MSSLDQPLALLGGMTARTFLTQYWQKQPLLIRQGLPNYTPPLEADELAGLAMEEDVESRIVVDNGDTPWALMQGPFSEDTFQSLPNQNWTLLVQAVDHWAPEIQTLKETFHFLPSWRMDDVMISYAVEGGSVGPHYDQYDVFLIQMAGKRRWQVLPPNQYQDTPLPGTPLHILAEFSPLEELDWVLEPGDILYLPPNFAHNGRALDDDCMTASVGFRAPSLQDVLTGIRDMVCDTPDEKQRFAAPFHQDETGHHAQIPAADIEYLQQALTQLALQPDLLADWFGRTMSEVKYPEYLSGFTQEEEDQALQQALSGQPFFRPGDARLCYYQKQSDVSLIQVFCNGACLEVSAELDTFIQAVCDQTEFDFSGLDIEQHPQLEELLRFFLRQQGLVELTPDDEAE